MEDLNNQENSENSEENSNSALDSFQNDTLNFNDLLPKTLKNDENRAQYMNLRKYIASS